MRRLLGLFSLTLGAAPAAAQPAVNSPAPDRVAVTVYRDPERAARQPMNLQWLNGFALVSETRTISLPAGESQIRFEGVAGGIIPQSAIVTGLPEDVVERNHDAFLLSPATLIERSLGRRVHLRRTDRATGRVQEQEAVVRSGAEGALVLQTEEGFEALRCSGLPETVAYDGVPPGLSAKPILSVRTRSSRAVTATVTLSYLATGFDWQANYVAHLSPAGDRLDLFAWVTLGSSDETSFVDASTQAVAGRLNREAVERRSRIGGSIRLQCWPSSTTSDVPLENDDEGSQEIVVTGTLMRAMAPPPPPPAPIVADAMMAQQEELGDLKLYRIPEPVTVASNSQKQVAFLHQASVAVRTLYRFEMPSYLAPGQGAWIPAPRLLAMRNERSQGLGLPLPAGRLVLFATGRERPILVGEGWLDDKSVGEEVEVPIGTAPGVQVRVTRETAKDGNGQYRLEVSNDGARPAAFQAQLQGQNVESATILGRRNGMPLWSVTVPANGRAELVYRVRS